MRGGGGGPRGRDSWGRGPGGRGQLGDEVVGGGDK